MLHLISLSPDDAEVVHELVSEFYPEPLRPTVAQARQGLSADFCLGVERNGALDGVMVAWLDNSMVEGRREEVVFVEDLVAEPADVELLFEKVLTQVADGTPIEGTLCRNAHEELVHEGTLSTLGYGLSGSYSYQDESNGEWMTWVRFEPRSHQEPSDVWEGASF